MDFRAALLLQRDVGDQAVDVAKLARFSDYHRLRVALRKRTHFDLCFTAVVLETVAYCTNTQNCGDICCESRPNNTTCNCYRGQPCVMETYKAIVHRKFKYFSHHPHSVPYREETFICPPKHQTRLHYFKPNL